MIYHVSIAEHHQSVERSRSGSEGSASNGSSSVDATLAPVLGATRSGTVTAHSSRDLLITVLGELVVPSGGSAWTQTLTASLGALDVQDKAARQAIARLHERGWLERTKVGRRTRWTVTQYADRLLTEGAQRIYGFGRETPEWDGRWTIVLASVPDSERHLRHRLTVGLTWAGFGSLGQGTWISPWPEREPEATRLLKEIGTSGAASFRAELGAVGTPTELAARAWDLSEVAAHHRSFLDKLPKDGEAKAIGADQHESARQLLAMVHRWRRFPFLDPGLPDALLPGDWPGHRAAERFTELREQWRSGAAGWFAETEETFGA